MGEQPAAVAAEVGEIAEAGVCEPGVGVSVVVVGVRAVQVAGIRTSMLRVSAWFMSVAWSYCTISASIPQLCLAAL